MISARDLRPQPPRDYNSSSESNLLNPAAHLPEGDPLNSHAPPKSREAVAIVGVLARPFRLPQWVLPATCAMAATGTGVSSIAAARKALGPLASPSPLFRSPLLSTGSGSSPNWLIDWSPRDAPADLCGYWPPS